MVKKIRTTAFLCVFLILLSFSLIACTDNGGDSRANAVLHGEGSVYAIAYSETMHEINIKSPQGFVYDVNNGVFAFTKGEDKVVYPGSTSKLITALFALSVLPADRIVEAGAELDFVKPGSSIAYIKKGHKLTVEMLIEGMMLPSGNDAAFVLATEVGRALTGKECTPEEAISTFISGVNSYTREIGLCGTYLTVPDGYAYKEQYTTTEDMAIVARLAMENDIIARYAGIQTDYVVYASGHTNTWVNTNLLLDPQSQYYSEHATGLKTGSINGEYSLIFSFEFDDGRKYIAGIFGADAKNDRFEDANTIINYFKELVQI